MICSVGIFGASGKMGREVSALLDARFSVQDTEFRKAEPGHSVDLWIDFSRPEGTMKLLTEIHTPVVIGTTGFSETELDRIRDYAENHAVLLAPNTSPGIQLMDQWLGSLPKGLGYELFLTEIHHKQKKDSPSGTAKQLLSALARAGYTQVDIHSVRAGTVPGQHQVELIGNGERITITHTVDNRRLFAEGALYGAAYLAKKGSGLYTMRDLITRES